MAVRAADLEVHGSRSVTVAGSAPVTGELAVFCRPVLEVPAYVRRDKSVLADAWLPDLVRLGVLEQYLGDGVIEKIVAKAEKNGQLRPRERRRLVSYPLAVRLAIAMTLLPASSYAEAMRTLAGLLADIPFTLDWHVPAGKTIGGWRLLIPAVVLEEVFWHSAGPLIGDGEPSAVMLAGMPVDAADGMLVNLADTQENRAYFGTTGTGDGSSPFPQLRIVAVTARAGHAILGAAIGTAREGEQTLLKVLAAEQPGIFAGRVTCFDRNFPGHGLILAVLLAGGQVIARVKGGIALPFDEEAPDRGWLADGSRTSWLNAESGKKEDRLPVRVLESSALVAGPDGEQVSETCTLITTCLDHQTVPAAAVRDAYRTRWSAPETTFGEDKATITGAGNRTSGPVLRSGSPQLALQEAWAWLAGTQLVRASAAASLRSQEAAARALRRKDPEPVTADEESFTAAWRHAVRSLETSQVTAVSSLAALAAAQDCAARAHLHALNAPGRDRHASRKQKARPGFGHTSATKQTVTGKYQVIEYAPVASANKLGVSRPYAPHAEPSDHNLIPDEASLPALAPVSRFCDRKEEPPPRGPWNRAPDPQRHAGASHDRPPPGKRPSRTHVTREPQNPRQAETPKGAGVGPERAGRRFCPGPGVPRARG